MEFNNGSNREPIDSNLARQLRESGSLIEDTRLERPRWFDGRFLAARDLIREQQYFLTREAHLGRAAGGGVASGLRIEQGRDAHTLRISAGHGVTPSGELVLIESSVELSLADIPRTEQMSGKFGLGRIPTPPLRSRTGLFALALRPVEFTANPIGAYPTSINGPRSVEDGDIIEATAVVLVPWIDNSQGTLDQRRGQVARDIFVVGTDRGLSTDVLPLAMIALDNNSLVWIDAPMLRRELGADRADLPGLGLAPRALRFAHLMQHQQHMAEIMSENGNRPFPAAAMFPALPPAGPLPPGVIDPNDFTQRYFPAEIDVDFAVIPEDELPALVEEALALPGFDLSADEATLDASAAVILAPIPRNQWRLVQARLRTLTRGLRPAAPNRIAARKPLEILQRMRLPGSTVQPAEASDAEWQRLARLDSLWYVRRRNLAYREDVTGSALRLAGRELLEDVLVFRATELGLKSKLDGVLERATPAARGEIAEMLSTTRISSSPAILAASIGELSRAETLNQQAALKISSDLTAPSFGEGLARLDAAGLTASPEALKTLAERTDLVDLDREAKRATQDTIKAFDLTADATTLRPVVVEPTPVSPIEESITPKTRPAEPTPTETKTPTESKPAMESKPAPTKKPPIATKPGTTRPVAPSEGTVATKRLTKGPVLAKPTKKPK
jgi:hypothetical protein